MEPILRDSDNIDWITILIFVSVLSMVIAKGLFYNRFLSFIWLPFNNKYIFMYSKKEKLMNWFHIFLSTFQLINLSLFIFFVWIIFKNDSVNGNGMTFPVILMGILAFGLIKSFLQFSNGFIFGSEKTIGEIVFNKLSYLNHSSIVMFLANVILAYVLKDSKIVVYIAVLLILFINVIGWVNVLRIHQKFIASHFFYFILYLCALEIAPFIIIGSYLNQ